MSQMGAVFFDCSSTLVDSEVICSHAYVTMFREFGIHVDLEEISTRFKDAKLYEVTDIISRGQSMAMVRADAERVYRVEVVRLSDTELEDVAGVNELLTSINAPMCVVSNGPVSKMRHSPGKLNMLHYFPEKLFGGYDIQCWKPDPVLMFHVAGAMNVNVEDCILVDDSSTDMQSGIDAGMEVFYFCADLHNKPIVHPKVITFTHLS